MSADGLGVIGREIARGQKWADRGLPDPVKVVSAEMLTKGIWRDGGVEGQRANREALDAFFAAHGGSEKPYCWDRT